MNYIVVVLALGLLSGAILALVAWPILSGMKADIRNMQSRAPTLRPHHWNPPLDAVANEEPNKTILYQ
jgi:hypothetical protein